MAKGVKDGSKKHELYEVWRGMKKRCSNPNDPDYKYYGGRGIKVCKAWKNNFWKFVKDMGDRPTGLTLDRINCNKGYYKNNCRWASRATQSRNRRNSLKDVPFGVAFERRTGKWQAVFKRKYIGIYETVEEANLAVIKRMNE